MRAGCLFTWYITHLTSLTYIHMLGVDCAFCSHVLVYPLLPGWGRSSHQLHKLGWESFIIRVNHIYNNQLLLPDLMPWVFPFFSFIPDCDLSVFNSIFILTSRSPVTHYFWSIFVISKFFPLWLYILSQVPPILLFLFSKYCC